MGFAPWQPSPHLSQALLTAAGADQSLSSGQRDGAAAHKHCLAVWVTLTPYVSPRDCLPKYRIPFPSGVGLHAGSVLHAFKT